MGLLRRRRGGLGGLMHARCNGGSGPVPFDFTAGGLIPAANCVQAFDPYIVQDLAQSYIDLTGNGNDAAVTVAPTMGAGGWVFNGTTQYVDTGIVPVEQPTMAIAFSSYVYASPGRDICGNNYMSFKPRYLSKYNAYVIAGSRIEADDQMPMTGGVVVISGEAIPDEPEAGWKGYRNGVGDCFYEEVECFPWMYTYFPAHTRTLFVGALNAATVTYANCVISRWALYDIPVSAAQAAALSAVMAVA